MRSAPGKNAGHDRSGHRPLLAVVGALALIAILGAAAWLVLGDEGRSEVVSDVITSEDAVALPAPATDLAPALDPDERRVRSIFDEASASRSPADWMDIWIEVVDEQGRPCPGASLRLTPGTPAEIEPHDDTSFRLRALEGTEVTVFAQAPGYSSMWERVTVRPAADVSSGGTSPTLVMRIHPGEWAQVLDPRGRPVTGRTVEFHWKIRRRRTEVTRGVSGPDGLVYCGYPPGRLEAAYLGETPRGHVPSPDRKLAVVGRSPLTLQAPNSSSAR